MFGRDQSFPNPIGVCIRGADELKLQAEWTSEKQRFLSKVRSGFLEFNASACGDALANTAMIFPAQQRR